MHIEYSQYEDQQPLNQSSKIQQIKSCVEYVFNATKYVAGAVIFPAGWVALIGFGIGAAVADYNGCRREDTELDRESCAWGSKHAEDGALYGALAGGLTALFFASCKVYSTRDASQLSFTKGVSDSCKVLNGHSSHP